MGFQGNRGKPWQKKMGFQGLFFHVWKTVRGQPISGLSSSQDHQFTPWQLWLDTLCQTGNGMLDRCALHI